MALAVVIRDAAAGEVEALEALQRAASMVWDSDRPLLVAHPDAIEVDPGAITDGRVRVAEDADGRTIGFSLVLAVDDGAVELDGLFVAPDVMGRGVGRALVDDAAARARTAGAAQIGVIANQNALGFYTRLGFVPDGMAQTRFRPAPRMRLALRDAGGAIAT